jgi:hypothetical protein
MDAILQGILALLVVLTLMIAWAIIEIRSLRNAVAPIGSIADSPLGRAVAGIAA